MPMRNLNGDVSIGAALAKPVASQIGGPLDFCNTAGEHLAARPDEMLLEWESFVRWAVQAGLIGPETYLELVRHPAPIDKILRLREAVYRVGLAIARGDRVPQRDLLAIRKQANASKPAIINSRDGLCWRPDPSRTSV
ncbi:MAG: ABATE domain-containing protein [Silvibacterium sp.]